MFFVITLPSFFEYWIHLRPNKAHSDCYYSSFRFWQLVICLYAVNLCYKAWSLSAWCAPVPLIILFWCDTRFLSNGCKTVIHWHTAQKVYTASGVLFLLSKKCWYKTSPVFTNSSDWHTVLSIDGCITKYIHIVSFRMQTKIQIDWKLFFFLFVFCQIGLQSIWLILDIRSSRMQWKYAQVSDQIRSLI